MIPPLSGWSVAAGGHEAPQGTNSYSHLTRNGSYRVWPDRRGHFRVWFANQPGDTGRWLGRGLWHYLGTVEEPEEAAELARQHDAMIEAQQ